jgi:hypothetical protein
MTDPRRYGREAWLRIKADPARLAAHRKRQAANARRRRRADPVREMLARAKARAAKLGLPFDITPGDVVIPARCPVFGEPIRAHSGTTCDWSPELDRIEPARGYVRGNVVVLSRRANRIKSDATIGELSRLAAFFDALF